MNKKFSKVLSLCISIFFIYLCLKDIPLKNLFKDIYFNLNLLIYGLILIFFVNILKALRFKILLSKYKKKNLNFYIKPALIRKFLNSTFFGNVGELAVPLIFKRYLKMTYIEGLSIVSIERLLDLSVISLFFGIGLYYIDFNFFNEIIILYFILYFSLILIFIFLINYKKKLFFFPKTYLEKFKIGYQMTIKDTRLFLKSIIITFIIWGVYIIIDLLLFKSFEITNPISSVPNIIFLTGVVLASQLIPAAPSSIGVFNFFVIQTIQKFYEVLNLEYNAQIEASLTSISIIVLILYIIPDITWGAYVFFKETSVNLKNIKIKQLTNI